jgi:hypothetical protein
MSKNVLTIFVNLQKLKESDDTNIFKEETIKFIRKNIGKIGFINIIGTPDTVYKTTLPSDTITEKDVENIELAIYSLDSKYHPKNTNLHKFTPIITTQLHHYLKITLIAQV